MVTDLTTPSTFTINYVCFSKQINIGASTGSISLVTDTIKPSDPRVLAQGAIFLNVDLVNEGCLITCDQFNLLVPYSYIDRVFLYKSM